MSKTLLSAFALVTATATGCAGVIPKEPANAPVDITPPSIISVACAGVNPAGHTVQVETGDLGLTLGQVTYDRLSVTPVTGSGRLPPGLALKSCDFDAPGGMKVECKEGSGIGTPVVLSGYYNTFSVKSSEISEATLSPLPPKAVWTTKPDAVIGGADLPNGASCTFSPL